MEQEMDDAHFAPLSQPQPPHFEQLKFLKTWIDFPPIDPL